MRKRYKARELLKLTKNQLWDLPETPMKIEFDDGVLESSQRAAIYSVYMWKCHRVYPKTPLLMRHHLGDLKITSSTHMELLGRAMWDCYSAYQGKLDLEALCKLVYEATNELYNDMTYRLEAYVNTVNILDFVDVALHPEIQKANDTVMASRVSIEHTYAAIEKVLRDPTQLKGNAVAGAVRGGLVDMKQVNQCVGPRGAVTDVDSSFFRDPILTGYVEGMRRLEDSMMESRSASKSLMFTEKPLQQSEYFNRKLQLLCGTMEHLHHTVNDSVAVAGKGKDRIHMGDCGSTHYLKWYVKSGDLPALVGKFYKTPDGLKVVTEKDKHLINKEIELRSVLYCMHPDPRGVCATCFGDLSLSIPADTCVGHVSATALCEKVSQSVLSVKHVDFASGSNDIELSEYERPYFKPGSEGNTIKLADALRKCNVLLSVDSKDAEKLSDIMFVDDVRQLPTPMISEIMEIMLNVRSASGKEESVFLTVGNGARRASMTHELLEYIKQKNWTLSETGRYGIDLSDWDMDLPILELPRKHENMLDYLKMIERFVASSTSSKIKQKTLARCHSVEEALYEFNTLVASRLQVNIAHLEVILKALMVRSIEERDYRIPHVGNEVVFGKYRKIMEMRSLSADMAYQGIRNTFLDPASYVYHKRPSHPLDEILVMTKQTP